MKVIDLQFYRTKKTVEALEKRIGRLALESGVGSVREMKTCFKEWLKISSKT
jgi:hypothetical protein